LKFTVVVPLYNKENHIARAINSVLNQSHQEFELIVVDDGSTDFGIREVKRFHDPRIRLIQQFNSGVSSARNKGISLAQYDFIGFLDADDAWKPGFLERICLLIEKYPEAGAFATAYEIINKMSKRVIPKSILSISKGWEGIADDYFKLALKGPLISASSVVIPKEIFNKIGMFREEIKRGEDLDMWCRVALNYDIVFSNQICATYYHNTNNRVCDRKAILADSIVIYAEDILSEGKRAKNYSSYFEDYMIDWIITKARYLIKENKGRMARKLLTKYSHTKYNKKALIKTYILSLVPKTVINLLYKIKWSFLESRKEWLCLCKR
jgi:glycosyltransferase involved in cell wall biosynthesis